MSYAMDHSSFRSKSSLRKDELSCADMLTHEELKFLMTHRGGQVMCCCQWRIQWAIRPRPFLFWKNSAMAIYYIGSLIWRHGLPQSCKCICMYICSCPRVGWTRRSDRSSRVTILPDFGGSGPHFGFLVFYWISLGSWIDMNLRILHSDLLFCYDI